MTPDDLLSIEGKLTEMNEHLSFIHEEVARNSYLTAQLCTISLFIVGTVGAVFVLFMLYKFLRQFF